MTPEGCACADIPLPDEEARKELFKIAMKGVGIDDGVDMDRLARETEGYSGDDVANVCRDGRVCLREHVLVTHASRPLCCTSRSCHDVDAQGTCCGTEGGAERDATA